MKSMRIWLYLIVIVVLIAAGCTPATPPPSVEPAQAEEPEAEAPQVEEPQVEPSATPIVGEAGTGKTKLVMWNGLTGSDGVTLVAMMQEYAKTHPDISVRVEMMPWDIYYDKLMTALVSGNPPDMFIMHDYTVHVLGPKGVLKDVSELFDKGGGQIPFDDFSPAAQIAVQYEGKIVGLPWDWHGWGLWWNKDLFKNAGLDPEKPPTNAQEYRDICMKITTDKNGKHPGEDGFDYANVVTWGCYVSFGRTDFLADLYQAGGDVQAPDGSVTINSDAAKEVLKYKMDLIYTDQAAPVTSGFDPWGAFAAGQLAMYPNGTWFTNFVTDAKVNYGVAEYPPIFSAKDTVWSSSHVIYIPPQNTGEKWEATKDLLTWLSDNSATWATAGMPPARNSVRNNLDPEEVYPSYVLGKSFEDHGRYEIPYLCYYEYMDVWTKGIDAIGNKQVGVDEGLTSLEQELQGVVDRCQ